VGRIAAEIPGNDVPQGRAAPLWRSGRTNGAVAMQAVRPGIVLWAPNGGTGIHSAEPYLLRSQMAPALALGRHARKCPDCEG